MKKNLKKSTPKKGSPVQPKAAARPDTNKTADPTHKGPSKKDIQEYQDNTIAFHDSQMKYLKSTAEYEELKARIAIARIQGLEATAAYVQHVESQKRMENEAGSQENRG